jgi:very-short-patch-repair endonuclease
MASMPRGVRCTTPARALLDAWRFADAGFRSELLYQTLWARICTPRHIERELAQAPRVAGRRELRRALDWFAEGATSPLEVRAKHVTFADARFREFEWQALVDVSGRRVRVDMLHRIARLIVELDGDTYHSTREARDADRERQTELAAAGYVVLRFGWREIVDRPQWCRDHVLAIVAARSR